MRRDYGRCDESNFSMWDFLLTSAKDATIVESQLQEEQNACKNM